MFRNHIKISIRKIINDKVFSIIKILSLAISIACSILIFQWVSNELSYDKFHPDYERIYRVLQNSTLNRNDPAETYALVCAAAGKAMKETYPQITYLARTAGLGKPLVKYKKEAFYEDKIIISEPDLLKIFNISFIKGNSENALSRPHTMLITESSSQKYFGNEDPVGKVIQMNAHDYEITGLIKDCPENSILQYEFILALAT